MPQTGHHIGVRLKFTFILFFFLYLQSKMW